MKTYKCLKKKYLFRFMLITTMVIAGILATIPYDVKADSNSNAIIDKAMLAGVYHCLDTTYLSKEITISPSATAWDIQNSLFSKTGAKDDEDSVKLPTQIGNDLKDSAVSCKELFFGYKSAFGGNDLIGFWGRGVNANAIKWVEALGYKRSTSPEVEKGDNTQKCAYVQYDTKVGSSLVTQKTDELCFEVEKDGKVKYNSAGNLAISSGKQTHTKNNIVSFARGVGLNVTLTTGCTYGKNKDRCFAASLLYPAGSYAELNFNEMVKDLPLYFKKGGTYEDGLCVEGGSDRWCKKYAKLENVKVIARDASKEEETSTSNYFKFDLTGRLTDVQNGAANFFSNGKYPNSAASRFNNIDRYTDYTYTLFNLFGIQTNSAAGCGGSKSDLSNQDLAVKLIDKSGNTIWVQLSEDSFNSAKSKKISDDVAEGKAYVIKKDSSNIEKDPVSVATIVSYLNYIEMSGLDVNGLTAVDSNTCIVDGVADLPIAPGAINPGEGDNGTLGSDIIECYTSANSLGWILCPVLQTAGHAARGIYDDFIVGQLELTTGLFDDSSGSYEGWKTFRNIANTVFAIGLVIVILAQLTGIGLSNYGIKKILPRLIMVVVLVNVSYIICQLAVDLSNVLGESLYSLFNNLASRVDPEPAHAGFFTFSNILGNILGLLGLGATGFVVVKMAIATWEFWLIPVLLAVFAGIVAIIMFFVIMGVRQAGVIVLVAIAPLAIVCYALPNAKPLFDRWRKLLTNLLVVYPIAGLLIGGSNYVSALMLKNGAGDNGTEVGFFTVLTALLITVVPIFFLPSLVRNSLRLMGNLGAKISGLGQKFSGGISRAVRNSEAGKDLQRSLNMRNDVRRGEKLQEKIKTREARWESGKRYKGPLGLLKNKNRLTEARNKQQRLSLDRKLGRYNKNRLEDAEAAGSMREFAKPGTAAYEAMLARVKDSEQEQAVKDIGSRYTSLDGLASMYNPRETVNMTDLWVDDNDPSTDGSLAKEHYALLRALDANPDDLDAQNRLRYIQDHLMSKGDKGQEVLRHNFARRLHDSSATALSDGAESGLSFAARNLATNDKSMAMLKSGDRGLFAMVNDLNDKKYHNAGTTLTRDSVDQYYGKAGTMAYTAATLAAANDGAIDRLSDNVAKGNITGDELGHLVSTANEALNSDTINLKPEVREKLENLVASAYGVSTSDAKYMAQASTKSLTSMSDRIRTANGGATYGAYSNLSADQKVSYDEARTIAESARAILQGPNAPHDTEKVEALQNILQSANAMGIKDSTGQDFGRVDNTRFDVHQAEAIQKMSPQDLLNVSSADRLALANAIRSPNAKQTDVSSIARLAGNTIMKHGNSLSQRDSQELHTLLANSLGAGSPVPGATSPTTGAKAFIEAGPAAIQSTINWLRTTPFTTPAEQAMARNVVENARIAANYYDGKASKSAIDGLLDIQVAANDAGIRDRNGNNF